jgi:hypothetical protein
MSTSVEPPSAEQLREAIRREDEALHRVVKYVYEGCDNGRITEENARILVTAADRAHARAVLPLHRQLSDRLREERR